MPRITEINDVSRLIWMCVTANPQITARRLAHMLTQGVARDERGSAFDYVHLLIDQMIADGFLKFYRVPRRDSESRHVVHLTAHKPRVASKYFGLKDFAVALEECVVPETLSLTWRPSKVADIAFRDGVTNSMDE